MQHKVLLLAALLVLGCANSAVALKGDTYEAVLNATGLPPGSKYVPPTGKVGSEEMNKSTTFLQHIHMFLTLLIFISLSQQTAKETFHFLMTDQGLSGNQTLKVSWTFDVPSSKYEFTTLDMVTTKLPGDPVFLNLYNFTYYDFYYFGNFSHGELSDGMVWSGVCPPSGVVAETWCVDYTPLEDNSTYIVAVLDPVNNIAVGGQLKYMPISLYGNGSIGTAGTESDLLSSIVYIATADPATVAFPDGYQNGYVPMVNASAGAIFQYLEANDTYVWSVDMENVRNPEALQIRYFVDLNYQPLLFNLTPDTPYPVPPKRLGAESTVGGNFTTADIANSLYAQTGLSWTSTNFNNTPNEFMLVITNTDNQTMIGFIYNAFSAPPPRPVIKGGNGNVELQNDFSETPYVVAAWITFLFMLLNIVGGFAAVRAMKYDERKKELEQQLKIAEAAKSKVASIST